MSRFSWIARVLMRGLLLCLWVSSVTAATAHAQQPAGPPEDATKLKAEADGYMDNLDFDQAHELYEKGYAVSKDPVFLYNSGRALQGLNRYPEALDRLERFRKEASPALIARVPGLDELIDKVRQNVATVTLTSSVAGARVLLDGKMVGKTPVDALRVNAGSTKIEVFKDGYRPSAMTVTLQGNEARTIDFDLIAMSQSGVLIVRSNATGASVTVGDKDLGATPAQAELAAGEHRVEVSHPDYETFVTTVVIKAGVSTKLEADLAPSAPVYERWWFWTIAGVVVAGGAVAGIVVAATNERDPDTGDIPPGQVATPIRMAPLPASVTTVGFMLPVFHF